MGSDPPRSRFTLDLQLGADTWNDLIRALDSLAHDLELRADQGVDRAG